AEGGEGGQEWRGVGVLDVESVEGKAWRSRPARLLGVAPADQERGQAVRQFARCHAPPEHRSAGLGPVAVDHVARVVAVTAGPGYGRVDILAGHGPPHQPAAIDAVAPEGARYGWLRLFGVRSADHLGRLGSARGQPGAGAA